jgi:hypothetical protein
MPGEMQANHYSRSHLEFPKLGEAAVVIMIMKIIRMKIQKVVQKMRDS